MDFKPTGEQRQLVQVARGIAAKYRPLVGDWENQRDIPPADLEDMRRTMHDHGFLGMAIPEEFGGQGRPYIDVVLAIEEFAKFTPPLVWLVVATSGGPAQIILANGSDYIKKRYLSALATGVSRCAVAMTEPEAGSATTDLESTARREGDVYILNGTKVFAGGAGLDGLYVVYARMGEKKGSDGVGALLVERGAPGLIFGKDSGLVSQRATSRKEMIFRDCRVPSENLLVAPGGFKNLMSAFNCERIQNCAWTLGLAQGAFEEAVRYSQQRKQFGKEIIEFQMIQNILADMAVSLEAGRLLVYRAAVGASDGRASAMESSIAKTYMSQAAPAVIDNAIQIFGAYGMSEDMPLERMWRDARGLAIAAGTVQMNKIRIVTELTGRRFSQRG